MPGSTIFLRLLGGFAISIDGRAALDQSWSRKKPLALIKILALQPGTEMSRDRLLAALWPELPQAGAATQLRKNRLYLRRAMADAGFDADLIDASDDAVRLSVDVVADTDVFSRAARAALANVMDQAMLTQAIDAYGGDLLPDDEREDWTEPARSQLRALYHQSLVACARQLESSARYAEAIAAVTRVIEADALNEDAQRTLIRLNALSGRSDLALKQYEAWRELLHAELGAAPDDETERLVAEIRAHALRPPGYVLSEEPFVGRSDELRELHAAFERVRAGAGGMVVLSGEAGIGKTRIAESFAAQAHQGGARVLWVRSYEDESERGFAHWIRLIGTLAKVPPPRASRTDQPESRMHALLASSSNEQDVMFSQVGEFLRRHARQHPLVLIFDDIQWCGADSLRLLHAVARELRDVPIMFLATVRTETADIPTAARPVIDDLLRDRKCQVLSLAGLTPQDVEGLIALTAVTGAVPSAQDLWAQTRGNPLFVTEMLRAINSAPPTAAPRLPLPHKVTGVISRRIHQLSDDSRKLLETAAVVGGEFTVSILAESVETPTPRLLDLLEEARANHIVAPVAASTDRFAFEHPLMREVIYNDLPLSQRAETHLRIARALEAHYGADLHAHAAELAHHYQRALPCGCDDEALQFLVEAGEQAIAELAFEDAASHLESALEIALERRPAEREQHGEVRLSLANALYRAYDGAQRERSEEMLRAALGDARACQSDPLFVRVVSSITGKRKSTLDVAPEKIDLLHEALAKLDDADIATRCLLSGRLAKELEGEPDDAPRLAAGRDAIALAAAVDPPTEASALAMLYGHDALAGPDTLAERLAVTEQLVRMRFQRGESVTVQSRLRRYAALLETGDLNAAEGEIRRLVETGEQHPVSTTRRWAERWSVLVSADRATTAGRFAAAEELAQRGMVLGQTAGDPDAMSILGSQLFQIRWHQGRLAELSSLANAVLDSAPGFWPWIVASALVQLSNGEEQAARAAFDRIAATHFLTIPRDRFWAITMTVVAELCSSFDNRERAAEILELIEPFAERVAVLGFGQVCGGAMARSAARLRSTLGDWDAAEKHFQAAMRANGALGALTWVAWTEVNYAEMLLRRGKRADITRARALLSSATKAARECGMAATLADAESLLARC